MLIRLSPQIRHLQCALLRSNSTESRAQEVRKVFGFSESDIPEPLKAGKSRTGPPQATPSNVARGDFGSDVISGSKKNDPDTGYGGRKAARQSVKVVAVRYPLVSGPGMIRLSHFYANENSPLLSSFCDVPILWPHACLHGVDFIKCPHSFYHSPVSFSSLQHFWDDKI